MLNHSNHITKLFEAAPRSGYISCVCVCVYVWCVRVRVREAQGIRDVHAVGPALTFPCVCVARDHTCDTHAARTVLHVVEKKQKKIPLIKVLISGRISTVKNSFCGAL